MRTLKIRFDHFDILLAMKGLSFKAVKGSSLLSSHMYRCEEYIGSYGLHNRELNNASGDETTVEKEMLVKYLREIYTCIPYDKIKIDGRSNFNEVELYKEVTKP